MIYRHEGNQSSVSPCQGLKSSWAMHWKDACVRHTLLTQLEENERLPSSQPIEASYGFMLPPVLNAVSFSSPAVPSA